LILKRAEPSLCLGWRFSSPRYPGSYSLGFMVEVYGRRQFPNQEAYPLDPLNDQIQLLDPLDQGFGSADDMTGDVLLKVLEG
jgi:hypothetical protein